MLTSVDRDSPLCCAAERARARLTKIGAEAHEIDAVAAALVATHGRFNLKRSMRGVRGGRTDERMPSPLAAGSIAPCFDARCASAFKPNTTACTAAHAGAESTFRSDSLFYGLADADGFVLKF